MAVVVNLAGAYAADIAAGISPLAEMMSCLHAIVEPEHHLETQPWLRHARSTMTPGLQNAVRHYAPLWARRRCRLLLPLDLPLGQSLDEEVGRLDKLPLHQFIEIAAEAVHGGGYPVAGLASHPERHQAFIASCERRSFQRAELARTILEDPEAVRSSLAEFFFQCETEFFHTEWLRIEHRLEAECAQVRARARVLQPAELIASLSPNAEVRHDPVSVSFDKLQTLTVNLNKRRCLLVPSVHNRPHLIVKDLPGLPVVIHFPVENAQPVESITPEQARARLAALAEPSRLAICRHLVNEAITTTELAERTGMTQPQVSRHLAHLREVDLLLSRREGRMVYHRLDVQRFRHLGVDVLLAIVQ
ncbi:DUF5937 family protein [Streptomyces sp. NPDC050625]|uniref:ArsR/SmtB family transcription factor n=1 Tax=Streptomyces sp. NPDC050625 TaxID=3154629 RepID=UPI0034138DE0